jgi:SAM-dependent methyltransferase
VSLWSSFQQHDGKRVFKWTHYLPVYEQHFSRFVNRPLTVLEIGCLGGGSLQMWKSFLGPHVTVVGADLNPACRELEEDQIHIRIGDQGDPAFLQSLVDEFGKFDIVIDDGSHLPHHQIISFQCLYPHVCDNGVYVVEDLHTNYWPDWGGGVKRPGTFMELAKDLVDSLNAYHARGALPVTEFTNSTMSMHFYDSMIVFEKGRMLRRHSQSVGRNEAGQRSSEEMQSVPYVPTR